MTRLFYIYGYYGSKNAGDEAFRLAFRQLLPAQAHLRFIRPSELADNHELSSRIHDDVKEGKARLIVGGGAIIGEPYFWSHIPSDTPYHIISADMGSQEHLVKRYMSTLRPMQMSWIRSEPDAEFMARLAPWQQQIFFCPDIVFALQATPTTLRNVSGLSIADRNLGLLKLMEKHCENTISTDQLRNKNMAIFLSDHYYDYKTIQASSALDGIERFAADTVFLRQLRLAIDELTPYYNIYFFSLSYWYNSIDAFTGYRIAKLSSRAPLYNLASSYVEPEDLLELMPYFDAAISMKFHGLIFPMTAGVPVMNLGSSKKNLDLSQQMNIATIMPEELTVSKFMETIKQVESAEYATSLAETTRLARESVLTTFARPDLWKQ